jgi:hypothetical protein
MGRCGRAAGPEGAGRVCFRRGTAPHPSVHLIGHATGTRPSGRQEIVPCRSVLAVSYGHRHARLVRHATQEDLDRIEVLLAELRGLPQLWERKRGYFSRGSRAFLHFHEDAGDLYVDVKLDTKFQRMKVTGGSEQADFLSRVREALESAS